MLNAIPLLGVFRHTEDFEFPYVNLIACIMLLVTGVELLVKQMLDKRAENAEDDE